MASHSHTPAEAFQMLRTHTLTHAPRGSALHHFQIHPRSTRGDTQRAAEKGEAAVQSPEFRRLLGEFAARRIIVVRTVVVRPGDGEFMAALRLRTHAAVEQGLEKVRVATLDQVIMGLGRTADAAMLSQYLESTETDNPAHSMWALFPPRRGGGDPPPMAIEHIVYEGDAFDHADVYLGDVPPALATWARLLRDLSDNSPDLHADAR